MITARIVVEYEGHWTLKLGDHGVYGKYLAYKFADNQSFALLVLVSKRLDATLDVLEQHDTIDEVQVINRDSFEWASQESAALLLRSKYRKIPPMELLTYEGFYPLGDPLLEAGKIHFDLFLNDQDALAYAVALLEDFGDVTVEHLSETFQYRAIPETAEFERLLDDFSPQEIAVLSLAVEKGYFANRRDTTIEAIATHIGTTPSTVSRHLRTARQKTIAFSLDYLIGPD